MSWCADFVGKGDFVHTTKIDVGDKSAVRAVFQRHSYEEAVGIVITSWRLDHLLTTGELAEQIGVHRTTLSAWEAGERELRVGTLKRLQKALRLENWQLGLSDGAA